jgi:MFS family permease
MTSGITTRDRQARISAYAAFAVQGLCFASLVTRVPQIQDAHHLSDGDIGLVLLLVPVIAGLGSVLSGLVFPRFGSAIVLRVAQPAVCVSIVLIGLTGDNNPALYVATALFGLFVGAVDASMNAQAVAVERRYGLSLLTGFYAIWSVAGILGGLWVSLANKVDMSLFVGFLIPSVAGIGISLATGHQLLRRTAEGSAPSAEALKAAAKRVPWRPILIVGIAMGCFYIADSAVSLYSTKYLTDDVHSSTAVAPLAYVVYQVAMVLSRGIADFGVRRFGATQVVRLGSLVGLVGMIGVLFAHSTPLAIVAFTVMGLGLCVVAPVSFSAVARVDPTGLGVAVARVNIFNYVGFVVGAAILGVITPVRVAFIVPTVLILVILALAKGFEPTPVEDAVDDPAVMERPVV